MRERAPQKHVCFVSEFLLHLHTYTCTINTVPFYYLWCCAINDNIYRQNTNIDKIYVYMQASDHRKNSHLSHKTYLFQYFWYFTQILCQYKKTCLYMYRQSSEKALLGQFPPPPPPPPPRLRYADYVQSLQWFKKRLVSIVRDK